MNDFTKLISLMCVLMVIQESEMVGEKAFAACKSFGEKMLECHNIMYPTSRVRVPIDLLQFPHMVLIGFRKNFKTLPKWNCGGSLISSQWVLTAAHCIEDPTNGPAACLRVGTATFEFDDVEELWQERKVAEIRAHPEYNPPSKYNDIALMRSDREFVLSRDIRIACLQIEEKIEEGEITAIGFGTTVPGALTGSQTLMKVNLDLIDSDVCNKSMKFMIRRKILSHGIVADQLCAGDYEKGGRDTCQGDSGGPLQVMPSRVECVNTFPLHKVIGVTSFGRDCGRKMAPGVYTRVSRYVEWIESIVWP